MGSKPKQKDYEAPDGEKASAAVANAEYKYFKEKYDPLLQKIQKLETIVARRVGAKHWASVRLRALLQLVGIASSD